MPRVSVVIPTHNRPAMVPLAVASARAAGEDVEIIVVDDASEDETAAVCRQLLDITYVRLDRRQGVGGARNVGLLASTGDYVAFLDDDDLRLAGSLDRQRRALDAAPEAGFPVGPLVMVDGDGRRFADGGRIHAGDVFWDLLAFALPVLPTAVLVRRECFLHVGLFDPRLVGIDDWDMWVRIAEVYSIAPVTEAVALYRYPAPMSGQGSSSLAQHYRRAARHQKRLLRLPRACAASPEQRRRARSAALATMSNHLLYSAWQWLPRGAVVYAAQNLLVSFVLTPFWPRPAILRSLGRRIGLALGVFPAARRRA